MVPYANLPEVQRKKDELFLETVKASFATYSPWAAQSVNEAQVQGTKERVDRRTRLPKITPATPKFDLTPHKPADNDPTKTARGRMAVKQRGKQNKRHAKKFVKEDLNLMAESTDADAAVIASAFEDPIAALIEAKKVGDTRLTSVIKNVWEGMPLERYAGMAKEGDLDGELAVFDHAVTLREDMGLTGNDFCWIERIRKPGGMVIYKTCSDKTPSDVYAESKESMDRDLILSVDRANIIRIVHGD
jgi:hypothetical protein